MRPGARGRGAVRAQSQGRAGGLPRLPPLASSAGRRWPCFPAASPAPLGDRTQAARERGAALAGPVPSTVCELTARLVPELQNYFQDNLEPICLSPAMQLRRVPGWLRLLAGADGKPPPGPAERSLSCSDSGTWAVRAGASRETPTFGDYR